MFRLLATALLGYVAYRIAREITDSVPEDFGSHLPQQHRRARPRTQATTRDAPKRSGPRRTSKRGGATPSPAS